jgi:ribosomal protein S8
MFPTMYNYANSYTFNMINLNIASKNLTFDMLATKKTAKMLTFLKSCGLIHTFRLLRLTNKRQVLRTYLIYYKNTSLNKNLKLISRPSRAFYISLQALRLLDKRSGNSVFILSTSKGLVTHKEALLQKNGGQLIGFFSL